MAYLNDVQRLILRAALADEDEALASFEEWQKHVSLDDIDGSDLRLIPLVYTNIGSKLAGPIAGRLKGIKRHTWIRNGFRMEICGKLLAHLSKQNIPAMLLKGAALMAAITNDFATRQMGDCDILVSKENRRAAFAALSNEGFSSIPYDWRQLSESEIDVFHGFTFELRDKIFDVIDLHWRPMRDVGSDELTSEFFDKSRRTAVFGQKAKVPCAEHMFLHCAIHGAELLPRQRYDWLVDAALIMRGTEQFDWSLLAAAAEKYRLGALLHASLKILTEEVQIQVPASVMKSIAPQKSSLIDRVEAATRNGDWRDTAVGEFAHLVQSVRRRRIDDLNLPVWSAIPKVWKLVTQPEGFDGSTTNADELISFPYGWHPADIDGRWSQYRLATIAIRAAESGFGKYLRLVMWPYLPNTSIRQKLRIYSGVKMLGSFRCDLRFPLPHVVAIRLSESMRRKKVLSLQFYLSNTFRPAIFENSGDQREIGLFISDIGTRPPKRDLTSAAIVIHGPDADKQVLWHGFSVPEEQGTWAVGGRADLQWEQAIPFPGNSTISIDVVAIHQTQLWLVPVRVFLNGVLLGKIRAHDLRALPKTFLFRMPDELRFVRHYHLCLKFFRLPFQKCEVDNRKLSMMIARVGHETQ